MVISRCIETSAVFLLMVESKWETHIVGLVVTGFQSAVNCFDNQSFR